jgi:hypothetical protein
MSYLSATGSLYLQNGGAGSQTIAEVLDQGNNAGGQALSGITLLSTGSIAVVNGITTGDLVTGSLVIQGNDYPVLGDLAPAIGDVGSIRIETFGAPVSTNSNTFITKTFTDIHQGFYCGKVELDFITDQENETTTAEIRVSYGSPVGTNIGFSLGLIKGGATVSTVVVPFFFYNRSVDTSPNAVITVQYRCTITGGGNWQSTTESDIDLFRVF